MAECEDALSKHSLLLKAAIASVADELGAQEARDLALDLTTVRTIEGYIMEETPSTVLFFTASGNAIYSVHMAKQKHDFSIRDTHWLLQVIPVAHTAGIAWRVVQAECCANDGWRAVTNRKKKHSSATTSSDNRRRSHRRGLRR